MMDLKTGSARGSKGHGSNIPFMAQVVYYKHLCLFKSSDNQMLAGWKDRIDHGEWL